MLSGYFEGYPGSRQPAVAPDDGRQVRAVRVEEAGDGRSKDSLEIRVMDYYTGKYRSVKTLSGGESFKASPFPGAGHERCHPGGRRGNQVEALFIDEGFGALDSESLDQACSADGTGGERQDDRDCFPCA